MDASDATWLASAALLLWVPICLLLFTRMSPPLAAAVAFLVAELFLPERVQFDLPAVPPLTKSSITSICVLLGCLWRARSEIRSARPGRGLDLLVLLLFVSAIGTALTNPDPLHYGPTTLSGLTLYDGISMAIQDLLYIGIPFFVGRALYRDRESVDLLLTSLVVAAVIYTGFILVELRLSPQWHKWIYGFHQHRFGQAFRFGGWRPMVFMGHGLALAMLLMAAAVAGAALSRTGKRILDFGAGAYAAWLTIVLVLCKSTAAIAYALVAIPAAALLAARTQLRVAVLVVVVVVAYPLLRAYDLFPTTAVTSWAAALGPDRAESVSFRFYHEDRLLEVARQRLAFGWGGYRRNRVFDDEGRDRSVTDGFWILQLGIRGVTGFIGAFGLLLFPVVLAFKRIRQVPAEVRAQLAALALIVVFYSVDMLPNGLFNVLPFFFAGALAGVGSASSEVALQPTVEEPDEPPPEPVRAPESYY